MVKSRVRASGIAAVSRVAAAVMEPLEVRRLMTAEYARPAESFVDSIGVNIHAHYFNTSYGNYSMWSEFLIDSGIRHVRDALIDSGDARYYDRLQALADAGVRSTLIPGGGVTPSNLAAVAGRLGPDVIEAFEGQNEVVSIYNGTNNPAAGEAARNFQRDWYNGIKGNAIFSDRPVYAPTFVGGSAAADTLGDVSAWADYGTLHSYPYARNALPSYNVSGEAAAAEAVSRDRALVVTETGFNTAVNSAGGKQPVTRTAHGKYVPRTLFQGFNAGANRSFLYELVDEYVDSGDDSEEKEYGLIARDAAPGGGPSVYSPKPGYTAVKNLISILEEGTFDPVADRWVSPEFATGALGYELLGQTSNVHSTLLQKSNGKFYLALWQDARSVNSDQRPVTDRAVAPAAVTLQFDSDVAGVKVYDPLVGTAGTTRTVSNRRVSLSVPDQVILVEVKRSTATPTDTIARGYWGFDDVNNIRGAADASGGDRDLAFSNGVYKSGGMDGAHLGHAAGFDGVDDLAATAGAVLNTAASYTVTAWVRADAADPFQVALSQDGNAVSAFKLGTDSAGRFRFRVQAGDSTTAASASVLSTAPVSTGQWYHLAGVFDKAAGKVRLYVNGASQGVATLPASFNATGKLVVGAAKWGGTRGDFWDGAIDEVRVFAEALDAASIARRASGDLGRAGWTLTASHSSAPASSAGDRSLRTKWSSGAAMTNGMWFQIDRGPGAQSAVNRLLLDSGSDQNSYARSYAVYVSDNGTDWATRPAIKTGSATGNKQVIWLDAPVRNRYVRIVNTAASSDYWRFADVRLFGAG